MVMSYVFKVAYKKQGRLVKTAVIYMTMIALLSVIRPALVHFNKAGLLSVIKKMQIRQCCTSGSPINAATVK